MLSRDELITVVWEAISQIRPQGGGGQIDQVLFIMMRQKAEGLIDYFAERFDEIFVCKPTSGATWAAAATTPGYDYVHG